MTTQETIDAPVESAMPQGIGERTIAISGNILAGLRQLGRHAITDTVEMVNGALYDSGIRGYKEPAQEQMFSDRLSGFEATIQDRIPYIETGLKAGSADFAYETPEALERHAYTRVRDSIGFDDALHWIRLAAEEVAPGPHVDQSNWVRGRIDDYSALLIKAGLSPEATQLLNIGLRAHCRLLAEQGYWQDDGQKVPPKSWPADPMRC